MSLPALAEVSDVEARLGRDLTDSEAIRLPVLLADASAKVRNFTGQEITERESTDRVRITARDGHVRLPQYPVTAVASVISVESSIAIPFFWDGITLWGWGRFPQSNIEAPFYNRARRHGVVVDATYTHGFADVPDDIVALVCQVAARALGSPADQSGITTESMEGYTYTLGAAAAAGGLGLLPAEKEILTGYMAPNAMPISML